MYRHKFKPLPTAARLNERLYYNQETGVVIWKERNVSEFDSQYRCDVWNSKFANKEAGCLLSDTKYRLLGLDLISYGVRRIIWKIMTGNDPINEIDHINEIRDDNRFDNLREAIVSENNHNRGIQKNNTSGYKGIFWRKDCKKWQGKVRFNYTRYYTGKFDAPEEAHFELCLIREKLHKEFANNG